MLEFLNAVGFLGEIIFSLCSRDHRDLMQTLWFICDSKFDYLLLRFLALWLCVTSPFLPASSDTLYAKWKCSFKDSVREWFRGLKYCCLLNVNQSNGHFVLLTTTTQEDLTQLKSVPEMHLFPAAFSEPPMHFQGFRKNKSHSVFPRFPATIARLFYFEGFFFSPQSTSFPFLLSISLFHFLWWAREKKNQILGCTVEGKQDGEWCSVVKCSKGVEAFL